MERRVVDGHGAEEATKSHRIVESKIDRIDPAPEQSGRRMDCGLCPDGERAGRAL
jgi:hypothetical protein